MVGNGVESEFFEAAELPFGRSGERDRGPYVLCVGGLNRLDGGDRMLGLAAALQASAPDMRVLLAGADHEADLLAQAEAHPNLQLLGYTLPQQLGGVYQRRGRPVLSDPIRNLWHRCGEAMAVRHAGSHLPFHGGPGNCR